MKVKQLKKYLENFDDNDTVIIGSWFADGNHNFLPNIPCCDPIRYKLNVKTAKENFAVIGHFDNCMAHQIFDDQLAKIS